MTTRDHPEIPENTNYSSVVLLTTVFWSHTKLAFRQRTHHVRQHWSMNDQHVTFNKQKIYAWVRSINLNLSWQKETGCSEKTRQPFQFKKPLWPLEWFPHLHGALECTSAVHSICAYWFRRSDPRARRRLALPAACDPRWPHLSRQQWLDLGQLDVVKLLHHWAALPLITPTEPAFQTG